MTTYLKNFLAMWIVLFVCLVLPISAVLGIIYGVILISMTYGPIAGAVGFTLFFLTFIAAIVADSR